MRYPRWHMGGADRRAVLFDVLPGEREAGKYYDGWKLLRFEDESRSSDGSTGINEYAMTHHRVVARCAA